MAIMNDTVGQLAAAAFQHGSDCRIGVVVGIIIQSKISFFFLRTIFVIQVMAVMLLMWRRRPL